MISLIPQRCFTRRSFLTAGTTCLALGLTGIAHAGAQMEEPLVDSVRSALSAAVSGQAPPEPLFASTDARMEYLRW
ncbi:MAG: lytic transglycosylase domain-containing protein, partial [Comamonas sp.]